MDFWDVLRLLARRWRIAVPMLVLTIVATSWVATSVKPDYQAIGHIMVLPPQIESNPDTVKKKVNPWVEEALAEAARLRIERKDTQDALNAAGFQGEWTAFIDGVTPRMEIEVIAPSAESAQATMIRLMEEVEAEVADRQRPLNIPPGEEITTVRLDDGGSVTTVTSKLKRAIVVVVGVGLIATVMVTVGTDALLRRNRRRKPGGERRAGPPILAGGGTPGPVPPPAAPIGAKQPQVKNGTTYGSGGGAAALESETSIIPKQSAAPEGAGKGLTVEYQSAAASEAAGLVPKSNGVTGGGATANGGGVSRNTDVPEDATIILPLSHVSASAAKRKSTEAKPN